MKLSVDLSLLLDAVEKMGAAERPFDPGITLDPIDIALRDYQVEISLKDIEFENGLASYQGRQVLLYIKDHSFRDNIVKALADGSDGNKFHIADCEKLKDMRARGRFDRYIVTNNLSGRFAIEGVNAFTQQRHSGTTELKVCKLCLKYLNYQGYKSGGIKSQIFGNFRIADFFDTYSVFFPYMPSGIADIKPVSYTKDWESISSSYRAKKKYICERCGVDMNSAKHLMHVHHKDGNKGNNNHSNLEALCADCHKKCAYHEHLFLLAEDAATINLLRHKQGIISVKTWADVYKYADIALHGLIKLLEDESVSLPAVAEVLSSGKSDITADLVWKKPKIAICIDPSIASKAKPLGWKVYSMNEFLDMSLNGNLRTITSKI